ncbi:MAG: hypothetical protein QOD92_1136 [Acidimicrobiaceae bacterium]
MARVVFLIIDALPPRHVTPKLMPALSALGDEGGSSVGRAVMTSATYPNHATFATGVDPLVHGLVANWIVAGGQPRPAQDVGPSVATIFDACRGAGRSSAAIVGDQHLIQVMGAHTADEHWPPDGVLPDDVVRDGHGYAADHEVLPRLLRVLDGDRPDLVVGHLNEPDTAAHVYGPDSEGAFESYRAADASIASIVEALRPTWSDTVLIVVSDHDQEEVDQEIALHRAAATAGLPLLCLPEGTAAIVWGEDETNGAWLDRIEGVAGHRQLWPEARLVWSEPRYSFRPPAPFRQEVADLGAHGGVRTRAQVAVVAGGDQHAIALAGSLNERPQIEATEWAPTVAELLNIERSRLSNAMGSSLVPKT